MKHNSPHIDLGLILIIRAICHSVQFVSLTFLRLYFRPCWHWEEDWCNELTWTVVLHSIEEVSLWQASDVLASLMLSGPQPTCIIEWQRTKVLQQCSTSPLTVHCILAMISGYGGNPPNTPRLFRSSASHCRRIHCDLFFRGKSLVQCNSLKLSVFVRG